jgi:phosphatidylglycerophosphatase A
MTKKSSDTAVAPAFLPPSARAAGVVATWFGCGYSPFAPGTVGSAAALAIGIALREWAGLPWWGFLALALLLTGPAIWAAGVTATVLKIKDPGCVVVDEVLGQWIALAGAHTYDWKHYAAAFILFRLFDIWKPAPVRQLESLPGGIGINADDMMAGVYAALVLFIAGWFNL